jgi:hypothetical protein
MSGLDFLLMGVARSGTTVVTDALNCVPRIFCAMEVLPETVSCKKVVFPQTFERILADLSDAHHARLTKLLAQKRGLATIVGNKNPGYYLTAERLTTDCPDLKLIFIYRAPKAFLSSWNGRAGNPNDTWHHGQRGVFGVLWLLAYLRVLTRIKTDCLIVSYDAFCKDIWQATEYLADYLGDGQYGHPLDADRIAALQQTADSLLSRSRPVLPGEAALLDTLRLDSVDEILGQSHLVPFAKIRERVQGYRASIDGIWGEAMLRALVAYDDPASVRYLLKMLHKPVLAQMCAEEAGLSPMFRKGLASLPRLFKLRRLLLRQCPDAMCKTSLARMQSALCEF